jgi:hypothetical protein
MERNSTVSVTGYMDLLRWRCSPRSERSEPVGGNRFRAASARIRSSSGVATNRVVGHGMTLAGK